MPLREKLQISAKSILANEIDAEDAVQEAYLRLWNIRAQLAAHPNISGYAMQTVKNICIDKLRSERFNIPLENVQVEGGNRNPYIYTEQKNDISIIKDIINTLPELQRRVMLMRDIDGYELKEIAEIMGSEITAVKVNLSRARKKVRDKFISINTIHTELNERFR